MKFTPGASARARASSLAIQRHELITELPEPGWALVRVESGQSTADAVAAYRNDPGVEYAQPNFVYRAAEVPNDPMYGQVWSLRNTDQTLTNAYTQPPDSPVPYPTNNPPGTVGNDINVAPAWNTISDCRNTKVAVIDTGVNYRHEDLASNMWSDDPTFPRHGYNFVAGNDDPMDADGHGTHVAGTIGAVGNNGKGIPGVCWKASIIAVKVLGVGGGTTAWIISGINFAIARGAKVINMSLGGGGTFDQLYSDAITSAMRADVAVVVAAGNEKSDNDAELSPVWPCNFSKTNANVVCVAALDQKYALADFSNWGATTVTLGAPGTNILSTWAGTSGLINDALDSGWTMTPTPGGGWSYSTITLTSGKFPILANPKTFPDLTYANGADDRAYKAFAVGAVDVAVAKFFTSVEVMAGDSFKVAYQAGASGTDPFAGGGTLLFATGARGGTTNAKFLSLNFDVGECKNSNCNFGFQVTSRATGTTGMGAAITRFRISTLNWNDTSYNTIGGTSMASPVVAGVVTLLRAYNPLYTYADVVNAITTSGRAVESLAGKTRTGMAIDAMKALAFIQAPTGVSATVK